MSKRTNEAGAPSVGNSPAASMFSGAGIGLMVGVMLGLAMSPTVAAFIGAVGAALAALLGLNDRHFSLNKGIRIGTFGVFAILGAGAGIHMKTHNVFAPSLSDQKEAIMEAGYSECQALDQLAGLSLRLTPPDADVNLAEQKDAYLSAGFTECQALSLLAAKPATVAAADTPTTDDAVAQRTSAMNSMLAGSGLMADAVEISACGNLRMLSYQSTLSFDEIRPAFDNAGNGWKNFAGTVMAANLDEVQKRELMFIARDSVCAGGALPTSTQCERLQSAAVQPGDALYTAFGDTESLVLVRDRVKQTMKTDSEQSVALRLLTGAVCKSP
ncbi:MAG: hypothetical protein ACR2QT_10610 [Woeseiaceae bacterium]